MTSFCINSNHDNQVAETTEVQNDDTNKHALIIAIGAYDREKTGWNPISSQNDVPLIKEALSLQGFQENNITLLRDEKADKDGILKALDDLEARVNKGDIVVVHYSGHGQQIFDNNGDELDGYDEALVSINAPARYHKIPGYTGQDHVRDEEFGEKITAIRQKVGKEGHVLVIMDSCHSGTGTRGGINQPRGGMEPFAPDGYNPEKKKETGSGMSEKTSSRGDAGNLANFVLFAGARFDELNYETKDDNGNGVGSLSYSISKAFTQVEQGETYRSLFAKVLAVMAEVAPNQSPMVEGNVDTGLFGGDENIKAQTPYFNIREINSNREIIIDGGIIHNLTQGSKVGLYKIGTKDPSEEKEKLIVEGKVSAVNTFSSTVTFDSDLELKNAKSAWAFVNELNVEGNKLKVSLEKLEPGIQKELTAKIRDFNVVTITNQNPDIIIIPSKDVDSPASRSAAPNALILRGRDIDIATTENEVSNTIKNYARGQFLKQVEYRDDQFMVDFEFIPVEMIKNATGWEEVKRLAIEDFMVDGVPEFPVGTQLKIKVINKGWADAYFNILDIQPDGYINPIAPNRGAGLPPEVCKIEAGTEKEIPNYFLTIGPPFGLETFKVFATGEQINLEPIIRSQGMTGTGSRGPGQFTGIELLLSDTYGTRGAGGVSTTTAEGSSYNKNFKIIQK